MRLLAAVGVLGLGVAERGRGEPLARDARTHQMVHHRLRAPLAQLQVRVGRTFAARVRFDAQLEDLRVLLQERDHLPKRGHARARHAGAVAREEHALTEPLELHLRLGRRDGRGVRAAVLVLEVVHRLRLGRTTIARVRDAVTVVIEVGAAVVVLEVVDVLRVHRATIRHVGDSVAVVVEIGAAVLLLEAIEIFGFARARIRSVEHTVAVVVGIGGAASTPASGNAGQARCAATASACS